ncbi:MAG: NnrU family protein [Rhodospirillales bacterium]
MTEFVLAIGFFLATHLFSTIRPLRDGLVRIIGQRTFVTLYSLLSLAVVVWIGYAYANAPYIELWPQLPWARWAPFTVMPVACLLVAAGLSSPNPFSLGAGARKFDPARPGIVAVTRHPVIWGMALWSITHLIANGDAASVMLFGLLLLLGLIGPASLDRKRRRTLGDEAWRQLLIDTRRTPLGRALVQTGVWRWLAAGALYAGLLAAHEAVIGVTPFPA